MMMKKEVLIMKTLMKDDCDYDDVGGDGIGIALYWPLTRRHTPHRQSPLLRLPIRPRMHALILQSTL